MGAHFLKDVLLPLCELCGARPSRVRVTRTLQNGQKHTESLCATCARAESGWLFGSMLGLGLVDGFPTDDEFAPDDDLDEHIAEAPFEALMDACFSGEGEGASSEHDEDEWMSDEDDPFTDSARDEDDPFADDDEEELGTRAPELNLFQTLDAVDGESDAQCAGCGATWAQITFDERAGCPKCYATFRASIAQLLAQVQREAQHVGKAPRTAQKRRLRLEHLRQRRDNQLAMLRNRLAEAVQSERYEEAATLRDKIKVVSSSLF